MTGLAALLSGRVPAGVYHWDTGLDAAEIGHAVGLSDWSCRRLDGSVTTTKTQFLAALGELLDFPETYGRNLDALADCLRDVPGPLVVVWDDWPVLAEKDRGTFDTALRILAARSEHGQPFAVLLRGEGPETDLPVLVD